MLITSSWIAQVAVTIVSALSLSSAALVHKRATVCNGHPELCERGYGNVTFVGAHNSYAVGTNNLATNQDYDVTQQLSDGIRLLQVQAHEQDGGIRLCHTNCFLYDGGTLEDYLGKVKTWMDANLEEVVTLLIVNDDQIPSASYDTVFQSAGLAPLSLVPPTQPMLYTDWPTLGSMIDASTKLVTFLSRGADGSIPYLIDEFSNVWETEFNVIEPTFDCNVNRTNGDPASQLYLINHFLDKEVSIVANGLAPDKDSLNQTNAAEGFGSLGLQATQCGAQHGRYPNFMLVDFYEFGGGSVFQVAADLNGVVYAPTSPIATPKPDTSGTSTSTSNAGVAVLQISRALRSGACAVLAGMALGAWTIL